MDWNNKKLEECVRVLRGCSKISEAVSVLKQREGYEDLTYPSLKSALRRYDMPPPSYHLGKDIDDNVFFDMDNREYYSNPPSLEEDSSPITMELDPDELDVDAYEVVYNGVAVEIPVDVARDATILYSNASDGVGKSKKEVIRSLAMLGHDVSGLSEKHLELFFKKIGQVKSSHPEIPADAAKDPIDVYRQNRTRRDIIKDQLSTETDLEYFISKTRNLERELSELKGLYDFLEEQNGYHNFKIYSDVSYRKAFRKTRVIPISDFHGGLVVKQQKFQRPDNVFNKHIFKLRVGKIINIISNMSLEGVDRIHISALGDMFEGLLANMRPGQHSGMDAFAFEQYQLVKNGVASIIDAVVKRVKVERRDIRVTVIGQGGNHDRVTSDKRFNSEHLINAMLMDALSERFREYDFLTINHGGVVCSIMLGEHNLITRHGHRDAPRSYNAAVAMKDNYGYDHARRTILMFGHLHNLSLMSGERWRAIGLSSLVGAGHYAKDVVNKASTSDFLMLDLDADGSQEQIIGPYILNSA